MAYSQQRSTNSSRLSSFPVFPAVHGDEIRARYENRYSYDVTQFKKKKRKRGPKKTSQDSVTTSANSCTCQNQEHPLPSLLDERNDVFQPTPIPDAVLVIR